MGKIWGLLKRKAISAKIEFLQSSSPFIWALHL